jgi:cytochrome P450
MAMVTIIGGNETTRNGLGTVALALARDSGLRARLRENGDRIPIFIEEALRLDAPATTTARTVLQDTELGGTTLPKGAGLLLLWGSACRDEAAFRSPDNLDMTRSNARAHSAFGHGIHFCAGSQLARIELTLSVQHWLRDFETFELAVPESEVNYASVLGFRGLPSLPVRLRADESRSAHPVA